ncbi:H/ACA ribonucleoprotein complex subunit GAR1 [Methanoregula sp.]|uniref:H/ACA ribonucleoprotein complex subunit GAR1 n=1 Tax=Methanoregula sp. TaxID=2052170 RepID=UPI003C765D2B
MKVVGRAMSTIGDRMLIIHCDAAQLPPLYSEVTDRKMQPVGKILDLFGNIKAPYAAVLCKGKCTVQPNEKLFTK